MSRFERFLYAQFDIGECKQNNFSLYACEVAQDAAKNITVTLRSKVDDLELVNLPCTPVRNGQEPAGCVHLKQYRCSIGQMLFIGRLNRPMLLYDASRLASKTTKLQAHQLKELSTCVRKSKRTSASLLYRSDPGLFLLEAYSDASMSHKDGEGARCAYILMLRNSDTVHPLHWERCKSSSSTAELLASADALDASLYLREVIGEGLAPPRLLFTLTPERCVDLCLPCVNRVRCRARWISRRCGKSSRTSASRRSTGYRAATRSPTR